MEVEQSSGPRRQAEEEADGSSGGGVDILQNSVQAALQLSHEEREAAVPAAVQTLLLDSDDREDTVKTIVSAVEAARSRLPAAAAPLLGRLREELDRSRDSDAKEPEHRKGANVRGQAAKAVEACRGDTESSSSEEADDGEGRPFCLGPVRLPLAVLLNIANCLEPEDLSPAAQACKSLCIPININLQYMLFLVRLLRLIVLGPELARALREQEGADTSSSDSEASSSSAERKGS